MLENKGYGEQCIVFCCVTFTNRLPGLNQLLWYYAAIEREKCSETKETAGSQKGNYLNESSPNMLQVTTTSCNENGTFTGESTCCLNITTSTSNVDCEIRMRFAK